MRPSVPLLALTLLLPTLTPMADEITIPPQAITVEDGDTLLVEIDGTPQRLQLLHIDAPEETDNPKFQRDLQRTRLAADELRALGQAATAHLRQLIKQSQGVTLSYNPEQRDRYGRLPADVLLDGQASLSLRMVQDGYATLIEAKPVAEPLDTAYPQAKAEAETKDNGLWAKNREATRLWFYAKP